MLVPALAAGASSTPGDGGRLEESGRLDIVPGFPVPEVASSWSPWKPYLADSGWVDRQVEMSERIWL